MQCLSVSIHFLQQYFFYIHWYLGRVFQPFYRFPIVGSHADKAVSLKMTTVQRQLSLVRLVLSIAGVFC